jgi:hypothetical protein
MRHIVRTVAGAVIVVHGLIHMLGVVKGFGWADVSGLSEPIGEAMAVAWLAAALVVTTVGALLIARFQRWWLAGVPAIVLSQAVIVTSWSDAKMGTAANAVLAVATLHGYLAEGSPGLRARYRRDRTRLAAGLIPAVNGNGDVLRLEDLADLPEPVAAYIVASGAIGSPHVCGFRAVAHGRIRGGPDDDWMPWVGEQLDTLTPAPGRIFTMDATMHGLPADVLHIYDRSGATMQAKAVSVFTVANASGPEMDHAETVTLFNDLCVLAPASLVDAPIEWTVIDDHHVSATYTNGAHRVTAELTFNDDHELVDFASDDRSRMAGDGLMVRERWSTPLTDYRTFGSRRVASFGRARWRPTDAEPFDYLEFHVDTISYLTRPTQRTTPTGADAKVAA